MRWSIIYLIEKPFFLNRKNNQKHIQDDIAQKNYTYVFISPEIAYLKKFKKYVFDYNKFTDWLYLLTIDEIYLINEWGKQFRPLYAEIKKI